MVWKTGRLRGVGVPPLGQKEGVVRFSCTSLSVDIAKAEFRYGLFGQPQDRVLEADIIDRLQSFFQRR